MTQGGSESGGSGVDSITGEPNYSMSGRSSAYGDNIQENLVGARSETSSLGAPAGFQVAKLSLFSKISMQIAALTLPL